MHNIHTVKVAQDDTFVDEVLDIGTIAILYFAHLLLEQMRILLAPLHHAIDTNLIQRLQNIHCRKKECTRTTGRIEDSNLLQRMIETSDKSMVVGRCKQIGNKRTDIQIIGDKIINLSNLAFRYLMQNRIAPLKPINSFTPYFCRQGPRFGSFVIPILAPFQ